MTRWRTDIPLTPLQLVRESRRVVADVMRRIPDTSLDPDDIAGDLVVDILRRLDPDSTVRIPATTRRGDPIPWRSWFYLRARSVCYAARRSELARRRRERDYHDATHP